VPGTKNALVELAPPLLGELADYLARHRGALGERLTPSVPAPRALSRPDGVALGRAHAKILDGLMSSLFAAGSAAVKRPKRVTLAAVGSYGRGAVAFRSDADVRLIVEPGVRSHDAAAEFVECLLYPLWDVGLSVGHQVMDGPEAVELAQSDLATATSLLDLRLLAGDEGLLRELSERAWSGIFSEGELGRFIERLEEEVSGRHARFGASVYLLEPDVKSGAGGLRDLDVARWAARARYRVGESENVWAELVRLGVLVAREAQEIEAAEEFLWRVRNRLHAHAGRRSDRLTFDEQETIGWDLGYGDRAEPSEDAKAAAAERLMQDYYLHARSITRAREQILIRATPPRRRGRPIELDLGEGVRLFDGQITFSSEQLASDPSLALRAYVNLVRNRAPLLPFAREAIVRCASDPTWCEALRASPAAAKAFVELLCTVADVPTKNGSIAAELHDVGLLLAMVPEFAPVTGRVHHDVYHVYTVDVHSVAALDSLRAMCRGDLAHERPLASRLAAEIARPRPLFLATLLHDVGKGYPDSTGSRKNHSVSGAELCDVILPRLGLGAEECAEARSLVLGHLAMYHTATRRDLDDPSTAEEFCKAVRGREGLRDLFLLTLADIGTTSPTALTSWKARMLDELYLAADAYLSGGNKHAADEERIKAVKDAAGALWKGQHHYLEEFVDSMPERYLLANTPEAIVAHAEVARSRGANVVAAALVPSRHPEVSELCVVAKDSPGLLAKISAAITAGRLEVLGAQVYSRTIHGASEAVDLFWVRDRTEGVQGTGRALPRLLRDLETVCAEGVDSEEFLRERTGQGSPWRERPSPAVLTDVVVDGRASPRHTILEVFAKDRPGLLYTLARTIHELGLSIALSKINTEGTKVADVFYVNELNGTKVESSARVAEIKERLLNAVTAQ